ARPEGRQGKRQGRQAPEEGRQGLRQAEEEAQEEAQEGQEAGQVRPASSRRVQPGLIEMATTNTEATMRKRSPKRRLTGMVCIAMTALFALPALAHADLLQSFTAEVRDQNGDPFTQAGGHPFDAFTDINFNQHDQNGQPVPDESVKTIQVDLPAG